MNLLVIIIITALLETLIPVTQSGEQVITRVTYACQIIKLDCIFVGAQKLSFSYCGLVFEYLSWKIKPGNSINMIVILVIMIIIWEVTFDVSTVYSWNQWFSTVSQ